MRIDRIAVVGGTGPQGRGLALRLALAGCAVMLGSRDRERALGVARDLGSERVVGMENREAVEADVDATIVAIPPEGLEATLPALRAPLAGRIVIDVVVPLVKRGGVVELAAPPGMRSASEQVQRLLPESHVVGAFKNVPAAHLANVALPLEGDVLVCGDEAEPRAAVAVLAGRIPNLRAVDAGTLRMAGPIEAITALLVTLNRRHRAQTSIRILGLGDR
jgi:NADPH-dependent F420 reductase